MEVEKLSPEAMSETEPAAGPAFPDEPCRVPPNERWSDLEKWVWQELCFGRIADINKKLGRIADPRKPEDWQDGRRRLAPRFLADLLLREPYRSGLHHNGVRIRGAWLDEPIDLSMVELSRSLWLLGSRVEEPADLKRLRAPADLSLAGSCFAARLDLGGARIDASIALGGGAKFTDVALDSARVGGQLNLAGATVVGLLSMDSIDIGQSLFMESLSECGADYSDVIVRSAKVGGQMNLIGTHVAGLLDADSAIIGQNLLMRSDGKISEQRAEFNDVSLRGSKIGGQIDLCSAKVTGLLNLDGTEINHGLLMASNRNASEQRAEFNEVVLRSAKIGGQVALIAAKIAGLLNANSTSIGQSLLMRSDSKVSEQRAVFNEVVLRGAKVGGQVDLTGAEVFGALDIDSTRIGQSMLMRTARGVSEHRAEFKDVSLKSTSIGGQISLIGAKVAGTLRIDSVLIGQSLLTRSDEEVSDKCPEFGGSIIVTFAEVGRSLDLCGAILSSFNLTGTKIGGELSLASTQWQGGGELVLRNVSVDTIQDTDEETTWPRVLDLVGFTYGRFGGWSTGVKRGSTWFINWLAKHEPYAPQVYRQCAQVLREMGHPDMAGDVLYAGRERERKEALRTGNNPRATGLTLLKWFIGYGYGQRLLWRPLAWVVGLVLLGTVILNQTGLPPGLSSQLAAAAYSFDMLLPIIELEKSHLDIVLDGWVRYYFYAQKVMGYALASFLIAGLAGLTR